MAQNRRPDLSSQCCDIALLKLITFFFNFLFIMSAFIFIGTAVWLLIYKWNFVVLLPGDQYQKSVYMMIASGISLFVVSLFGCFAISKSRPLLVFLYNILLVGILILNVILCATAFAYFDRVGIDLPKSLKLLLIRDHSVSASVTQAFEALHLQGKCCGATTFENWRDSVWWQNVNTAALSESRRYDVAVPDFCCRTPSVDCGRRDHPSNIYYEGCIRFLLNYVHEQLVIFSGIAFAVVVIQLVALVYTTCLCTKLKDFSNFRSNVRHSRSNLNSH